MFPLQVLGYGSHGTVVLRGSLNGRPVAVKRMLSRFNRAADREVSWWYWVDIVDAVGNVLLVLLILLFFFLFLFLMTVFLLLFLSLLIAIF